MILSRLWTEVLGVFGPARSTSCFLSIGTGMPANKALTKPHLTGDHDVEQAFASIATNTEIVNILFRSLINAFAPAAQAKKYWRMNVGHKLPDKDDYESVGDLDDVGALKKLIEMTDEYILAQDDAIDECAKALAVSLH
jgi:hypothetical protein